ncbi:hypothetical protein ACHHYP_01218 [Achlya hypogyna]|uniref:TRAF-type domain-containing protein n=1 Tax=Achlya hypogyna TaxID=1202772 RepID=A0A1V9Z949_ACHHY|nr:hypothetical protein ACHHYP_01218 [Achlya hypogyna]
MVKEVVLPKVPQAPSLVAWSPARLPSRDAVLWRSIREIDEQRARLLDKAQRRCASTSALECPPLGAVSPPRAPRIVFLEDHTLCGCGQDVPLRRLKQHQEVECPHRLVACPHRGCDTEFPAHQRAHHEATTCAVHARTQSLAALHELKATHHVCCEACECPVLLRDLDVHCVLECGRRVVTCPNAALGCRASVVWSELEAHYRDSCPVAKRKVLLLEAAKTVNEVIPCDWCNEPVKKRHMTDHKEDECLMRERQCPNWPLGCREWVPVGKFDEHVHTVCAVTIARHELAKQATAKDAMAACRECGEAVPLRKLPAHAKAQCPARLVPCANVIHGCTATLKFRDRHIHEEVDASLETRATLFFATRNGHLCIDAGDDLKPPWCAEYWVWLFSKADDVLAFMAEALKWQAKLREMYPRLDHWIAEEKKLKDQLKALAQRKLGAATDGDMTALQAQAATIDDGIDVAPKGCTQRYMVAITGCKSIIAEARTRVQSLVTDASLLVQSITDVAERASLSEKVRAQAQVLEPSWPREDLDIFGHVEKWLSALRQAAAAAKATEAPHAKLIKKRLQLLQAIQDHERSRPTDIRESARFLKQARKELARLDEKLVSCVDIPLALVQSPVGFHSLATSKTAGIHLVMASGGAAVGLHTFDRKVRFKADVPRERWVHVAFNATAESVQVLIDGLPVDERPGEFHLPMELVGAKEKSFRGHLQEVRYWSVNRTTAEIQAAMRDTLTLTPPLRAYWTLEEGMGAFVDDVSGRVPRAPLHHATWSHYTAANLQRLGDPPTPSYRQRHMCPVVTRRNLLASKHQMRQASAVCSQGCGQDVPVKRMQIHHACECPHRSVVCPEAGCGVVFRLSQGHSCVVRDRRRELAAEYHRKHEMVECPFGCGVWIVRQSLARHRKLDCSCRFVMCPNAGCGRSYIKRSERWHVEHDCDAPRLLAEREMVRRARLRQAAAPRPSATRGPRAEPPRQRRPVTTAL